MPWIQKWISALNTPETTSNTQKNKQNNKEKDLYIFILLTLKTYSNKNGNIRKRTTVTGPIPKDSNWKKILSSLHKKEELVFAYVFYEYKQKIQKEREIQQSNLWSLRQKFICIDWQNLRQF